MSEPHRIRLRGHWQTAPLENGQLRYTRRFGQPRTLDAGERMWLLFDGLPAGAEVAVNGHRPAAILAGGFDMTAWLEVRNEVTIDVPAGVVIEEVVLEIRG